MGPTNETKNIEYRDITGRQTLDRSLLVFILKKSAKILIGVLIFVWLFSHFFLYIDLKNGCFIKIYPSFLEFSNTAMKDGLRYLKKNYFHDYQEVCKNVETIDPNIGCGGFGGGCYSSSQPKTIVISTTHGNSLNAAKVIIHETCHLLQLKSGRPLLEPECYAKDSVIPWHVQ